MVRDHIGGHHCGRAGSKTGVRTALIYDEYMAAYIEDLHTVYNGARVQDAVAVKVWPLTRGVGNLHTAPRQSSCFQAGLFLRPAGFLTIAAGAAENQPGNRFSPTPPGRFLHAPGRHLLRSLHKGSICSASRNHLGGSISDLVRSSSEASARGEPFKILKYTMGDKKRVLAKIKKCFTNLLVQISF